MDISSSMAVGGMRVALQVATAFKRPVLEIYSQLRNVSAPPVEFPIHDSRGEVTGTQLHRFTDTFFDFLLINIGGVRAENVCIQFAGSTECFPGGLLPRMIQDHPISKFPPGQSLMLFRLPSEYVEPSAELFRFGVRFDGPNEGVNRIARTWSRLRKQPQYTYQFTFDPKQYDGSHLPSAEYNG